MVCYSFNVTILFSLGSFRFSSLSLRFMRCVCVSVFYRFLFTFDARLCGIGYVQDSEFCWFTFRSIDHLSFSFAVFLLRDIQAKHMVSECDRTQLDVEMCNINHQMHVLIDFRFFSSISLHISYNTTLHSLTPHHNCITSNNWLQGRESEKERESIDSIIDV